MPPPARTWTPRSPPTPVLHRRPTRDRPLGSARLLPRHPHHPRRPRCPRPAGRCCGGRWTRRQARARAHVSHRLQRASLRLAGDKALGGFAVVRGDPSEYAVHIAKVQSHEAFDILVVKHFGTEQPKNGFQKPATLLRGYALGPTQCSARLGNTVEQQPFDRLPCLLLQQGHQAKVDEAPLIGALKSRKSLRAIDRSWAKIIPMLAKEAFEAVGRNWFAYLVRPSVGSLCPPEKIPLVT